MKIVMLGTRGVPAKHGGFETAVEEIGSRLANRGHQVIVYCRNPEQRLEASRGMRLINLPAIRQRHLETLSHTALSVAHAVIRIKPDVAILFNAGNAPLIPFLRSAGVPVSVHIDGLEWKRGKWSGPASRYYKWAERFSVRHATEIIADAEAIATYVWETYRTRSAFIPYGAPVIAGDTSWEILPGGLRQNGYHLVVARFEPENYVKEIVAGYHASDCTLPLVVVGSSPYSSDYTREIHLAADGDPRVRFLGPVWEQPVLNALYANCLSYLHGHSVGGTNPSLLRAMGAAAPVIARDVVFNREVAQESAEYFTDEHDLPQRLKCAEHDPASAQLRGELGQDRVREKYDWDLVAASYESLVERLHKSRRNPA